MKNRLAFLSRFAMAAFLIIGLCANADSFDIDDRSETRSQLTLADLAAYRAALSGRATADAAQPNDVAVEVSFKELWDQAERFRGRRVIVKGRIQKIFRQGPVGHFPALAEIWISSSAGDPFCLVVPQENNIVVSASDVPVVEPAGSSLAFPALGETVRFTGTFLKMVRYSGGDVARLAPLVVGDRTPVRSFSLKRAAGAKPSDSRAGGPIDKRLAPALRSPLSWLLAVTVVAVGAGLLARRQLHSPSRLRSRYRRFIETTKRRSPDPPLEFIDPPNEL